MTEVDLFSQALAEVGDYEITLAAAQTVTAATAANPVVMTVATHGYASGDLVLVTEMDEMTPINGRVFKIAVLTASTFQLVGEDGTDYTAETTGGLVQKLAKSRHASEVFAKWDVARREVLESYPWNDATALTRLARLDSAKTITAATQASPCQLTITGHGYASGDLALIDGIVGMVQLNGRYFSLTVVDANTVSIAEDATTYDAYVSGGTARKALTPLKPDFGYDYRYDLPSDCLRVLSIEEDNVVDQKAKWERAGDAFLTDIGITVRIRYLRLLKDPARYKGLLIGAFASWLAYRIAWRVTQNRGKEEAQRDRAEDQMRMAHASDGREQGPSDLVESDWVTARY